MSKPVIEPAALAEVVARYPDLGAFRGITANGLSINTPACLFETATGTYFAKRFDPALWSEAELLAEHGLVERLREAGVPTPRVHADAEGKTVSWEGGAPYAIYDQARGEDRYGRLGVFEPFRSLAEAHSAGAMLARFHQAFEGRPLPAVKPFRGLSARYELVRSASVAAGFEALLAEAPALRAALGGREELPWLLGRMEGYRGAIAPHLAALPRGVIHGDFIKRNLFWEGDQVSDVIDFDLWNVGDWVFDLALALLPCGFNWPRLLAGEGGPNGADMRAFLAGYRQTRELAIAEREVLPVVIESARFEFYLSAMVAKPADAELFWGLLVGVFRWFEAHPGWWQLGNLESPPI